MGVSSFGFGVEGLQFGVQEFGFRVQNFVFRSSGFGFGVLGFGCHFQGFGLLALNIAYRAIQFGVDRAGLSAHGIQDFRVERFRGGAFGFGIWLLGVHLALSGNRKP